MKLCAIISEYNPFHNGHKYHIDESLKKSGCDGILVVMNSNFSQRGTPTIVDKKTRALMAIYGGASAVAQLPTYFSVTNAETFAFSAVKTVCAFNDVTHLSFGSECGDIKSITELAKFLNKEPTFFKQEIKKFLNEGFSLGTAKIKALASCINKNLVKFSNPKMILDLLSKPNNILGVEYVKALLKLKSKIIPITVKRQEPYDGYEMDLDYKLSNATHIRESIQKTKKIWNIRKYIPALPFLVFSRYIKENNIPDLDLFGKLILFKLRTTSASELAFNFDVVEGFENKLISSARESTNFETFLDRTSSKRYSSKRVQRIVTSCLLNLRSNNTKQIFETKEVPFVKIIACINDKNLIASLHNSSTTIVTRKIDALEALKDDYAKTLSFAEDKANSLYELLIDTPQITQLENAKSSDIFAKTIFVSKDELSPKYFKD